MKTKLLFLNLAFCLILVALSSQVFAQNKTILKPFASTIVKHNGQNAETIIYNNTNEKLTKKSKLLQKPLEIKNVNSIDTLSYRRTLGGNWNIDFGLFGQDYIIQWFEAPTDLTIKEIGAAFSDNANGTDVIFKIYKVGNGITRNDLINVGPTEVKQGRFVALDPTYALGYVGFEDESDGSGYQNEGNLSAFPFADDIWANPFWQWPPTPIPSPVDNPVYQFVRLLDYGFEPDLLRGEIFSIVLKNLSIHFNDDRIGVWARATNSNPDYYGWKFYAYGSTPGDTSTAYWYSKTFAFDFAAVVDLYGDCFIHFTDHTPLCTTLSTDPRIVNVSVIGEAMQYNVNLNYSSDEGSTWQSIPMNFLGSTDYEATIPGFPAGSNIIYYFLATDPNDSTCYSESQPFTYTIFQKQKDVLFIYNGGDFSINNARRYYIGGNTSGTAVIVDPVDNDIWTAADGTDEAADVMSLYHWVVEVAGSYPDADFTAAAKTYLSGATSGDARNYFLSSQDYGCYLNGSCADINFVAGDFQYDYLGISVLGPQDLPGNIIGLDAVSGDPVSGWVAQYASDNSVGYFYDPSFELGFTNYIDAITPTTSAVPIFSTTTGSQVVAVRNEGPNWKTAFLVFDYAGSNFRSDTSLTPENDPEYALAITVGNQARKFLEWAEYPTYVNPTNTNIPDKFNLSQNYPNPFNPSTKISWQSPVGNWKTLKVYDVLGNEVATLVDEYRNAGSYEINFNASKLSSGVYFYQLKAGDFIQTKKMIFIK